MNPVDPMHWSNLAKAQERLGAVSEAAESLSRAKSLHTAAVSSSGRLESPTSSGRSGSSGRNERKGGRRKTINATPDTQASKKSRRRQQSSPPRDVKTIIEEAIAVAESGDLESALKLFQEVRIIPACLSK